MTGDLDDRTARRWGVAVFVVFVAVRAWTFAASDNGIDFHHNAYDRGLFVENWIAEYEPVPDEAYGPVGFYLLAAVMAVVPNPVLAPRALAFAASIAAFLVIASFTRRVFGARASLVAQVLAALHPHGIRLSVVGLDMMPYAALLMAAFWALDRFAGQDERPVGWAVASGLLFTLAAGTRFECWPLLPVVGLWVLARMRVKGLAWVAAAALFPAWWLVWQYGRFGDPFHFLSISGGVSRLHMADWPAWRRLLAWPAVLARYAPITTALAGAFGLVAMRHARRGQALALSAAVLFAVFEWRTLRGALGVNETKYAMPLALLAIPHAGAWLARGWGGPVWRRWAVAAVLAVTAILALFVTQDDNRRFALPRGAVELAQFLRTTPKAPERVLLGTSLQGFLIVAGDLGDDRAVRAAPSVPGAFSEDDLRRLLAEPCTRYLQYEFGNPVDFAPVLALAPGAEEAERFGFALRCVFLSVDRHFAVYRADPPGETAPCVAPD